MSVNKTAAEAEAGMTLTEVKEEILRDYRTCVMSREASLLGRREVLGGKAKFGIFGDGKELAQVAMAKQFRPGDWRSGYYRDMTFMFAIGELTVQQWFAQLYAHADLNADPASAGRQMNGHFATRSLDAHGNWKNLAEQYNSSPDISPTAGQMPRLLGLAQASKVFRRNSALHGHTHLSDQGNEVAFGTIGDASTSEGHFWETMNAAGVLQVPLAMSVWDDGWGISVSKDHQTTKGSISTLLQGFQKEEGTNGIRIHRTRGWDYAHLNRTYEAAIAQCREEHVPCLVHVEEVTQPQGHSTSGSHERYKSTELLEWYKVYDCNVKFREWVLGFKPGGEAIATAEELDAIEQQTKADVKAAQKAAWTAYQEEIKRERDEVTSLIDAVAGLTTDNEQLRSLSAELKAEMNPGRKEVLSTARRAVRQAGALVGTDAGAALQAWIDRSLADNAERYGSHLYSESAKSCLNVDEVPVEYADDAELVDGRVIIRDNFAALFEQEPLLLTFGEDTGKIGDVNQGMEGMQARFGELRVSDTGIREATILGQGIGMALRGLRPVAEIQYLDYLLYCLQGISDDLATVHWRTRGGQKCPLIVRTRGHRLEGVWHSGSPMGMILNSVRGVVLCVPRNMQQAAGMYNTLLQSDDPAIVIECLNGYRTKERMPANLGAFTVPIGIPEVVREGEDLTIVSYGSTFTICAKACETLAAMGIAVELIDARTLLPFDRHHVIVESLKKTNRLLVVDEDVPGGASAYILQQILEVQGGYRYLDAAPSTLTAKAHRPAYGSDGDYFSKPSVEDVVEKVLAMVRE
ncbi:MAG: transketolase C-terminal domain-containing protein [Flavobacteriales bacterium]|jgi:pyruvate/2-oxoglutarate/acetoin dehydrogenase E1 component/TPP-dependent pyruvate/acetoin dehydrogenase alpha subunit|nr:transketolase C-terminal domain-containing protein [Flavobacteriales bacterium]